MIKFAWLSNKRQWERELLKLAKERGVTGIAIWFNHKQIIINSNPDTSSDFRQDMKFGMPQKLLSKAFWINSSPESSQVYSKISLGGRLESGATHLIGLGISITSATISSSRQKRKRDKRLNGESRLKRSRSDSSYTSGTDV